MSVSGCVNGRWIERWGKCDCDYLWVGSDCSIPDCLSGSFNSTTRQCQCSHGYTGQFCHINICVHNGEWYCRSDHTDHQFHPCSHQDLLNCNLDASHLACSCGRGNRVISANGTDWNCICDDGYYGQLCQWKLCQTGPLQTLWTGGPCPENNITQINTIKQGRGVFGFGLSSDFLLAVLVMVTFLVVLLAFVRLFTRRIRSRRARDEENTAVGEFRALRSSQNRFPVNIDRFEHDSLGGYDEERLKVQNDTENRTEPARDVFWWKKGQRSGKRPMAGRRLTIVLEENSDVEEGNV